MSNGTQGFYALMPQNMNTSNSDKNPTMKPVCEKYRPEDYLIKGRPLNEKVKKVCKILLPTKLWLVSMVIMSSLLFGFLYYMTYLAPCGDLRDCPVKATNWEYEMLDVEFKGEINVIPGVLRRKWNLAVMYEASRSADVDKNGVISFMGKNSEVMYNFQQESKPEFLDCSIIDLSTFRLSYYDCVLVDKKGLKVIVTKSGTAYWHAYSHTPNVSLTGLTNPLKLDDLNDDRINEILCIYQGNHFLVICGETGRAMAEVKLDCDQIHDVKLVDYDSRINYACRKNNTDKYYQIKVDDVRVKYWNPYIDVKPTEISIEPMQENLSGNRSLIVINNGVGPDCYSNVSLYDYDMNQLNTFSYKGYIMKPHNVSFQSTAENSTLNGFVFKLWEWKPLITGDNISYANLNTSQSWQITEKILLIIFNSTEVKVLNVNTTEIIQLCKTEGDCQPSIENKEYSLLVGDIDQDDKQELVSHRSTYKLHSDGNWHLFSYLKVFRLEDELSKLPELYN